MLEKLSCIIYNYNYYELKIFRPIKMIISGNNIPYIKKLNTQYGMITNLSEP